MAKNSKKALSVTAKSRAVRHVATEKIMRLVSKKKDSLRVSLQIARPQNTKRLTQSDESRTLSGSRPLLSVIVPVYNVAEYLPSCLDSLMNQTYTNIEVVVVDDGSPDNSYQIAADFAASYHNIKVVRRANGGLGAARNTGIDFATGEYLTFVDSDDTIPIDAYASMMSATAKSGSDVVVGALVRQRGKNEIRPEWVKRLHSIDRFGINAVDFPEILRDFYSPNKIYRSDFWRENNFRFREGVLFEDQPVITQALTLARKIDVLQRTTYRWLIRDDGSSLSQNMYTAEKIAARRDAIGLTKRFLLEQGDDVLYRAWQETLVEYHFPAYLAQSRKIDSGAYATVIEMIRDVVSNDDLLTMTGLMPQNKVLCYLALNSSREVVEHVVAEGIRDIRRQEIVSIEGESFMKMCLPEFTDCVVPPTLALITSAHRKLETHCHRVIWMESSKLKIEGWASVSLTNLVSRPQEKWLELTSQVSGEVNRIDVQDIRIHQAAINARNRFIDNSITAFEAVIDFDLFRDPNQSKDGRVDEWIISMACVQPNGTVLREPFQTRTSKGTAELLYSSQDAGRIIYRPKWSGAHGLRVVAERRASVASQLLLNAASFSMSLRTNSGFIPEIVSFTGERSKIVHSYPVNFINGEYIASSQWGNLDIISDRFSVKIEDKKGKARAVHFADFGGVLDVPESVTIARNKFSAISLIHSDRVTIESVEARDGNVVVIGKFSNEVERPIFAQLKSGKASSEVVAPTKYLDSWVWEIDLKSSQKHQPDRRLKKGWYEISFHRISPTGNISIKPVNLSNDLAADLPLRIDQPRLQGKFAIHSGKLSLHVMDGVPLAERSEFARQKSREAVFAGAKLETAFFFQCLIGDAANDSQLAMHKYLHAVHPEIPLYWGVTDTSVSLPDGAIPRYIQSTDWYDSIHRSKYVCVNHELPAVYVKQPGQRVIQTYHGHPFKIMGVPRWKEQGVSEHEIDRNLTLRSQWDYLAAPSPIAADLYKNAFPIPVQVLVEGHARNDDLARIPEEHRMKVRNALGIRDNQTAVLYAPTWRDYEASSPWVSKMSDLLNPYELALELGPNYVVLLRGHPAHQRFGVNASAHEGVINVTDHSQINDLIAASDIGVFDYSSIRFDYSVTRKPMIFFVPDEEIYFEDTPPLIPYDETTPGRKVYSNHELAEAIRNIDNDKLEFAEKYEEFVHRFNPKDDGQSAARLVERIFQLG